MKRCPGRAGDWTLSEVIFDLPRLEREIAQLEEKSAQPDFWSDPSSANRELQKLSRMRNVVTPYSALDGRHSDITELIELLHEEPNDELEAEVETMVDEFIRDLEAYELQSLLNGEYDGRNALVEIDAGAGGSEACDWTEMLFRMYSRWAQEKGFKFELMSETPGDVTGYRGVSFQITGENAYGYLRSEHGVHRLVRISPFDAAARRHTSFARVEVLPEMDETEVSIKPDDLKIDTLRAGGAGGQHVNKTESSVRITHIPTGIVVTCENERSQHKNRASAMHVLAARLSELQRSQDEDKMRAIRGDMGPAEWGRQIRSYVMQPYTMVKDHRTGHETGNVTGVMDGGIDGFIEAYLKRPPESPDEFIE